MALLSPEPPAHSTTVKLSIMFPPKADPQSVHPQVPVVLRLLHFTHVALTSGSAGMDYSLYLDPHPAPVRSSLISLRTFLSSPEKIKVGRG